MHNVKWFIGKWILFCFALFFISPLMNSLNIDCGDGKLLWMGMLAADAMQAVNNKSRTEKIKLLFDDFIESNAVVFMNDEKGLIKVEFSIIVADSSIITKPVEFISRDMKFSLTDFESNSILFEKYKKQQGHNNYNNGDNDVQTYCSKSANGLDHFLKACITILNKEYFFIGIYTLDGLQIEIKPSQKKSKKKKIYHDMSIFIESKRQVSQGGDSTDYHVWDRVSKPCSNLATDQDNSTSIQLLKEHEALSNYLTQRATSSLSHLESIAKNGEISGPVMNIDTYPTRWTDCYNHDEVQRKVKIGILVDQSFQEHCEASSSCISTEAIVETAVARLQIVYGYQLNIDIVVDDIVYAGDTTRDYPDFLDVGSKNCTESKTATGDKVQVCCEDNLAIDARLTAMRTWAYDLKINSGDITRKAFWVLLTGCHDAPGLVGMAYYGTLCHFSYSVAVVSYAEIDKLWLRLAHEIGHVFNASHTFQNGVSTTGGIMDYGDGLYQGIYQFITQYSKAEICSEIQTQVDSCLYISTNYDNGKPKCGDKIWETPHEECECADGSTSCKYCENCKLKNHAKCTPEGIRNDASQCCLSNGQFASASTTCSLSFQDGTSSTGVCINGQCEALCLQQFGSTPTGPSTPCGSSNGGCVLSCTRNAKCSRSYTLPDYSRCDGNGTCISGVCVPDFHRIRPGPGECQDHAPWFDSGGSVYNCTWYVDYQMCDRIGHEFRNFGMTGSQACCACGGGINGDSNDEYYESKNPTNQPTRAPTSKPSMNPSLRPTLKPSVPPTFKPTMKPTLNPTMRPTTYHPTNAPTKSPTTPKPTNAPTLRPSLQPTFHPIPVPSSSPVVAPTRSPTRPPSPRSTSSPTKKPTKKKKTFSPTLLPTKTPSLYVTCPPAAAYDVCPGKSPKACKKAKKLCTYCSNDRTCQPGKDKRICTMPYLFVYEC